MTRKPAPQNTPVPVSQTGTFSAPSRTPPAQAVAQWEHSHQTPFLANHSHQRWEYSHQEPFLGLRCRLPPVMSMVGWTHWPITCR